MAYRPNSAYQQPYQQIATPQQNGIYHNSAPDSQQTIVTGQDVVSGDQYRYALQNFVRATHELKPLKLMPVNAH